MHAATQLLRAPLAAPLTWSLAALTLLAFVAPDQFQWLQLQLDGSQRPTLAGWLGCHLLHWSAEHLFWDLGMFVLLGTLCEKSMPVRYFSVLALSALLIPASIMACHPEITSYRGLSGLDTALFSLLVTAAFFETKASEHPLGKRLLGGLLCGLLGKTIFEFASGGILFVDASNFVPLPVAHLLGIVIGVVLALAKRPPAISHDNSCGAPAHASPGTPFAFQQLHGNRPEVSLWRAPLRRAVADRQPEGTIAPHPCPRE